MAKEKSYKIVFERNSCIGAAACTSVAPEFWEMKDDGKAHLIGGKTDKDGNEVLVIKESQMTKEMKSALKLNKSAAEVCPVQVIHIFDAETNEKLV
ncbi:Ferredoxin [uncultured archaeon]|nr:Ferredoxin [uncultured archaeon]